MLCYSCKKSETFPRSRLTGTVGYIRVLSVTFFRGVGANVWFCPVGVWCRALSCVDVGCCRALSCALGYCRVVSCTVACCRVLSCVVVLCRVLSAIVVCCRALACAVASSSRLLSYTIVL